MNALLERYKDEYTKAKARHDADVAHASLTKSALPDNYWHAEHSARQRLRIARELMAAMGEDQ